eukprot:gene26685-biopygen4520
MEPNRGHPKFRTVIPISDNILTLSLVGRRQNAVNNRDQFRLRLWNRTRIRSSIDVLPCVNDVSNSSPIPQIGSPCRNPR